MRSELCARAAPVFGEPVAQDLANLYDKLAAVGLVQTSHKPYVPPTSDHNNVPRTPMLSPTLPMRRAERFMDATPYPSATGERLAVSSCCRRTSALCFVEGPSFAARARSNHGVDRNMQHAQILRPRATVRRAVLARSTVAAQRLAHGVADGACHNSHMV